MRIRVASAVVDFHGEDSFFVDEHVVSFDSIFSSFVSFTKKSEKFERRYSHMELKRYAIEQSTERLLILSRDDV